MQSHELITGLPPVSSIFPLCEGYLYGKHSKNPYPNDPLTQCNFALALIHTNLSGPMKTPLMNRGIYFLIFIDNFS